MTQPNLIKIAVIRLSAMGDVAMSVQAVRNALEHNHDIQITVITRNHFQPFFGTHERLKFHSVDLKGKHKGFLGLQKLYRELKLDNYDYFLDLHDVLRSKILKTRFKWSKTKVFTIDKGRQEKLNIVNKKGPLRQLKPMVNRYFDVFKSAGFKLSEDYCFSLFSEVKNSSGQKIIGIAPFAAHSSKEWGLKNIEQLIKMLTPTNAQIRLFGGGPEELKLIKNLEHKFPSAISMAGKHNLSEELKKMSECDFFIAMDSGNMHLAALTGTKVFSIWIATHPYLGFAPWQNEQNCLFLSENEVPELPVSVFGKIKDSSDLQTLEKARILLSPAKVMQRISVELNDI